MANSAKQQHGRKTSAAYYTPSGLVSLVLDEALEPLLDEAVKDNATAEAQEAALLAITVCDPSCGGGAFLVPAARRIAARLVEVRNGAGNASLWDHIWALHEVIARNIYGVDLNPLAVELTKVVLAVECLHPALPAPFLDGHLKVGNALLGTTPALFAGGIPDSAFVTLTGDDPKWTKMLKARNKRERLADTGPVGLFAPPEATRTPPTTGKPWVREAEPENYFSPFGVQLMDPDDLAAAVQHEMAKVNRESLQTLMWKTADARWLVGWADALSKQRAEFSQLDAAGEQTAVGEELRILTVIDQEYSRVNKLIDDDPLRHFDSMMYTDSPRAAAARTHLAYVLAHLAHLPGGYTFAGIHWETDTTITAGGLL